VDIKIEFGTMEALAGDIGTQASSLQSTLESLKSRIDPVIAQWEGATSGAYQASQAKWNQAAEDLQQVLAQIGTAVRAAGEAFEQGEKQNTNRWG
jgi:early secretory antigenic target protein ESAT-6